MLKGTRVGPEALTVTLTSTIGNCAPGVEAVRPSTKSMFWPAGGARRTKLPPASLRTKAEPSVTVTPCIGCGTASAAITRALVGAAVSVKSPVAPTVNVRLAVPRLVVTTSGPVVAPIGTVVVIWVAVTVRTTAVRPLNVTVVEPGSKLVPVIVTKVPMVPLAGSTLVIDGPNRTVKVRVAGVRSSFPARSSAFTSNVCDPSVSPVQIAVVGVAVTEKDTGDR